MAAAVNLTGTLIELNGAGPGGLSGIGIEIDLGSVIFLPMQIERIREVSHLLYEKITVTVDVHVAART